MVDENQKMFSLRLSGEGINIEQEVDQHVALRIVQVVIGGGVPAAFSLPSAGSHAELAISRGSVALSLREVPRQNRRLQRSQIRSRLLRTTFVSMNAKVISAATISAQDS